MRTAEVTAATGAKRTTLRFYERRGLLPSPLRTTGGHRVYDANDVLRVRCIKAMQQLGLTLAEVAAVLGARGRMRRRSTLAEAAGRRLVEVDDELARLSEQAARLRAVLDAGCSDPAVCASVPGCPIPFGG